MAAALGVSLTHRDYAHSVRFVTGHAKDGALPKSLDWKGLADPETTLIIYMGGRTGRDCANRLAGEGLDLSTPVVVVTAVSRANEEIWKGTLADFVRRSAGLTTVQPVLIGIGRAFAACATDAQSDWTAKEMRLSI